MPGSMAKNFKGGNLAEDLGLLLIRQVCAVAEFRRQDDYGIDAVATLLRGNQTRRLTAEASFLLQIKSTSVSEVVYANEQFDWLLSQSLPFFIATVSLNDSEISIYPTIDANTSFQFNGVRQVRFLLGTPAPFATQIDWPRFNIQHDPDDIVNIYCETPVVRYSMSDITNRELMKDIYATLKSMVAIIEVEKRNIELGHCSKLMWQTNCPKHLCAHFGQLDSAQNVEAAMLVERLVQILQAIMAHALVRPPEQKESLISSALSMLATVEKCGFSVGDTKLHEFYRISKDWPTTK